MTPSNRTDNSSMSEESYAGNKVEREFDSTIELRQIMVVTDFSSKSRRTYTYAVRLAKRFGAEIQLVHFARKRAPEYSGITNQQHIKHLHQSLVKESKQAAFLDLPIKTSLLEMRDFAQSFSGFQNESACQLIIAHTLAHKGMQRHFDHQLAEKIIANSTVPVLLFGPAAFDSGIEQPKSVLVPFDFSNKATTTFPALRFLDKHYQCSFRLLLVQTFRSHWFQKTMRANEIQIQSFEKAFEELIATELTDLEVELEIQQGQAEMEFCRRACGAEFDLIVIGTYGRLGHLTKDIIRNSKCPIMAVPINWSLG